MQKDLCQYLKRRVEITRSESRRKVILRHLHFRQLKLFFLKIPNRTFKQHSDVPAEKVVFDDHVADAVPQRPA